MDICWSNKQINLLFTSCCLRDNFKKLEFLTYSSTSGNVLFHQQIYIMFVEIDIIFLWFHLFWIQIEYQLLEDTQANITAIVWSNQLLEDTQANITEAVWSNQLLEDTQANITAAVSSSKIVWCSTKTCQITLKLVMTMTKCWQSKTKLKRNLSQTAG